MAGTDEAWLGLGCMAGTGMHGWDWDAWPGTGMHGLVLHGLVHHTLVHPCYTTLGTPRVHRATVASVPYRALPHASHSRVVIDVYWIPIYHITLRVTHYPNGPLGLTIIDCY